MRLFFSILLERESELGQSDGLHALQDLQVDEDPQFQNTHTGDRKADLLLVDSQLEAKGLKKVENGEPDLYVGYSVTLGQPKKQTAAAPVADSSSWQTGSSWSEHNPSDKAARKGTLNVDIAEVKKNLLVWRGSVVAEVGDSMNDARVKISKGVSKAFGQYPPPAK